MTYDSNNHNCNRQGYRNSKSNKGSAADQHNCSSSSGYWYLRQ